MKTIFDVIIVGGGGSGLAAAVSTAENRASVLLLEKRPNLGGSTGISVGSFTANRTIHQKKAGIDDNTDDHEADASLFGPLEYRSRNNGPLRKFFFSHSGETLKWLMDMGLNFHGPTPEPPNRVPRMHNIIPNSKAYIAILQARLIALGGIINCNSKVNKLIKDGNRITGVDAQINDTDKSIVFLARRGVVLAAGDYSSSSEIISRFKGPKFANIDGINPYCNGDGHLMAETVGARLVNMDMTYGPEIRFIPPARKPFSQLLPASGFLAKLLGRLLPLIPKFVIQAMIKRLLVTWQHPDDKLFEDGAILINKLGNRFCNEKISPDREIKISEQPEKICFILIDKNLSEKYSKWPHFISTAPKIAYAYVKDYIRLRPDITLSRSKLKELAEDADLPQGALEKTVEEFNRYASGKKPDPLGRVGDHSALLDEHWVLLGPAKAYFTTTEGGVEINTSFQVIGLDGKPIEGLYAVGTNGISGMNLWCHGLHIAWAMTSGRLVGKILSNSSAGL